MAHFPIPSGDVAAPPDDVAEQVGWFYDQPDARERFRWSLRDSVDELLDGQRTGRWCYQQLSKTEKTYLGTAVEVNLTKEFGIENGQDLDWSVAGEDLDCKFSKDLGGWEIPMEMYLCEDHAGRSGRADSRAMLIWLDDDRGLWAAGIIVITDERLAWRTGDKSVRAYNRDNKRRLNTAAFKDIHWLWGGIQRDLPSNLILRLPGEQRDRILHGSSGQQRVNALFREVTGRVIGRNTVLSVGQQDDAPKRARDARKQLRDEGVVVIGHQEAHPQLARLLGLTVPVKGEWISARLTPVGRADGRPKVWLDDQWWAVARAEDPVAPAPKVPRVELPKQPDWRESAQAAGWNVTHGVEPLWESSRYSDD